MSRTSFRFDSVLTGLFYLGMAITGMIGFLMIRPEMLVDEVARPDKIRACIALELGIVTFQALAAISFARLFRETDAFAAGALALLGMVNAIVILGSAAMLGGALDAPASSPLLVQLSGRFWQVGNIFFGLWLMPMGWLALRARFGPRLLGWILIAGGVGYVLNAFASVLLPGASTLGAVLTIPASIGEFWMIGLLLWTGLRRD